jgi:hypothetical protein
LPFDWLRATPSSVEGLRRRRQRRCRDDERCGKAAKHARHYLRE